MAQFPQFDWTGAWKQARGASDAVTVIRNICWIVLSVLGGIFMIWSFIRDWFFPVFAFGVVGAQFLWAFVSLIGAIRQIRKSGTPLQQEPPPSTPPERRSVPTWRTTGEFPLIAGVWRGGDHDITITQAAGQGMFIATTKYTKGQTEVTWRAEGLIGKDGHGTAALVHTHPHALGTWKPQWLVIELKSEGTRIEGSHDIIGDQAQKLGWVLQKPRDPIDRGQPV